MKKLPGLAGAVIVALVAVVLLVWMLGVHDPVLVDDAARPGLPPDAQLIDRGAYLARAGNCAGCHTRRGAPVPSGGRAIETPFGTVFSSNLTPDPQTGIGNWSAAHFWRAMHHGRSRDGRLLLPVFPYTSYTQITREDSDALFAYFRSLPATTQANRAHELRWPYDSQWALAVWRTLYFRPGSFEAQPDRGAEWNRGAYLVRGLGHCNACHSTRNALGASTDRSELTGGPVPMQGWYAPSLVRASEAGVAQWGVADVVQLLQTGVSARGSALGPMAEVVLHSTQHLAGADLRAMAVYLQALPVVAGDGVVSVPGTPPRVTDAGAKLYERHCAECHGDKGEGVALAYPPLAGNRAVRMADVTNLVQIVLRGGFAPATVGNPRPFGMPPFQMVLSDGDVAEVITHIRSAWDNQAGEVTGFDVARHRAGSRRD
jgi:mono/diheme cytochrome c family protein